MRQPRAVEHFDAAVSQLLTFQSDPLAELDQAIAMDPDFLMAYVLKALIWGLSTEKPLVIAARKLLAGSVRIRTGGSSRETLHVAAVESWLSGRFSGACTLWEDILIRHPDDVIAMFAAHQGDFLLGRSGELRDRVARRLPDIERGSALDGHYLGMYAFGLEETGDYGRALEAARQAVARDPQDAWAIHAGAHVFEMTNQIETGEHWLDAHLTGWEGSNLAVHIAWHLALYYCDRRRWDRVLELYDTRIRRPQSPVVMEMLDASALLWRLEIHDVDAGNRWQSLAEAWEAHIDAAWYAFNDMHAMMAFAGAGRRDLARRLLKVLSVTAGESTENGVVTREVGLPVAEGLLAYAEHRYSDAVAHLSPVRAIGIRSGGSHAQRDVFAQTLLSAAEKSGQRGLARDMVNERLALRPDSELNRSWLDRLGGSDAL